MLKLGTTIYSMQSDFRAHRYDLYHCLKRLHELDIKGIEIVPSQNFTGLQEEGLDLDFYKQWNDWMEEFGMTPTNYNLYDEPCIYKNRWLTEYERIGQLRKGLEIAKKLGFKTARLSVDYGLPNTKHLENSVKCCEEYGIIGTIEVHSPYALKSNWAHAWFETIDKLGTKYAGIHPDAGIFRTGPAKLACENAIKKGANPDIIEMIKEEYAKYAKLRRERKEMLQLPGDYRSTFGYGEPEIVEKIKAMGGGPLECRLISRFSCEDPAWMEEYAKYIVHFHGKFYEIQKDENGELYETSIDYPGIVEALTRMGYDGWVSTEWEGQMMFGDAVSGLEIPKGEEYVKLQHDMIRQMEKKIII